MVDDPPELDPEEAMFQYICSGKSGATASQLESAEDRYRLGNLTVPSNPRTGESKGFAFLQFPSRDSAQDVVQAFMTREKSRSGLQTRREETLPDVRAELVVANNQITQDNNA